MSHTRVVARAEVAGYKRAFILQQGLDEPEAANIDRLYSALLFQPRVVGVILVTASVLRQPPLFAVLAALLTWSALIPRWNPFDALYNRTLARGALLAPARPPRRFAMALAAGFTMAIAAALAAGWYTAALVLEVFMLAAVTAVVFGGFCLGSFTYHVLRRLRS